MSVFFQYAALLTCLYCPLYNLQAQTDSLPLVVIAALPLRTSLPGERTEQWNQQSVAAYRHQSVADLLLRESGLYLKSYGLGSLATLSSRGGGAGQTAVLWNGFPIQSPMLGLLDVAMMPAGFSDGVSVHYGGNSAQWGSGAVGGMLALYNQKPENKGLGLQCSGMAGSFGAQSHFAKIAFVGSSLSSVTRVLWQASNNDFPYRKRPELPVIRQTNAAVRQQGFLQECYWQYNAKNELAFRVWGQSADRGIPPLTTQTNNVATQADDFLRTGLHWKRTGVRAVLTARVGYFTEYLDYQDALIALRAKSHFNTGLSEFEGQWMWRKKLKIHAGASHTRVRAYADGYVSPPTENRTAVFSALRYTGAKVEIQANARQEWQDGTRTPLMPGIGATWQPLHWLKIKEKSVRNYRQPTLNDRYWRPGGNPDLLPESGWSHEAGVVLSPLKGLEYTATAYRRTVKNWILWSIREGQSYWSSNNITSVYSRGVEQRLQYVLRRNNLHFLLAAGYDFTRSTNQVALKNPRLAAGAQLLYVPVHQAFAKIECRVSALSVAYQHRYTGMVSGVNEAVPAYNLGFCNIAYQMHWGKQPPPALVPYRFGCTLFFHADNIWNVSYRVVERRPMPGRSFRVGVFFQFK